MYVVFLRFSNNKAQAPQLMTEHNAWIKSGFDDGVFLVAGSLQPKAGGAIEARDVTRAELETRVQSDPLVAQDVVSADIREITPARVDDRLDFLMP